MSERDDMCDREEIISCYWIGFCGGYLVDWLKIILSKTCHK